MYIFSIRMILQNFYRPIVHVRYKVHTVLFEKGKGACFFQGCRNHGGRGCLRPPDFDGSVNPILTRGAYYAHMPPLPSAFKTFWHPWLAFAYERTQKSKAKRRKLKKFISINLQWLSFFSVLSSLFQFLFFSPSLSPSAFCSRSSALCNITIGWNHFWGIFSFFCLRFSSNLVQITEWNQSM